VPVGGVVPSTTPVAPVSVSGDERWGCRTS
jgi:hypothetical protein